MTTTTDDATGVVTEQVLHLPVDRIVPDPANPRVKLRDIEGLTASVKQHGVLEPVTVREVVLPSSNGVADVDGYMVVRGHRRLAAAQAAKVDTVRCIVVSADQAERVRATHRMVENLQRDDLTASEVAAGVQQLLDLGLSADDVAGDLTLSVDDVTRASKVAQSKGVPKVAARMDLSMDEAAALAEFETDREVFKELTTLLVDNPGRFDHRVAQYRRARQAEAAVTTASTTWVDQGYKVLTGQESSATNTLPLHAIRAQRAKSATDTVTPAQHKGCPGRAVVLQVGRDDKVEASHFCVDPEAHGHTLLYKRDGNGHLTAVGARGAAAGKAADKTPKQAEADKVANRTHRAALNAGKAAQDVRRAFVRQLLSRSTMAKGWLEFTSTVVLTDYFRQEGYGEEYAQLAGVPAPATKYSAMDVQAAYLKKLGPKVVGNALLALAMAKVEAVWFPNTWDEKPSDRGRATSRKLYLQLLVANGYTPSTVENVLLGKATGAQVLAEADALKATTAAKAQLAKAAAPTRKAPASKRTAKRAAKSAPGKRTGAAKRAAKRP